MVTGVPQSTPDKTVKTNGLVAIAGLALQACATTAPSPRQDTAVRMFVPFGPGRVLQPGVSIAERLDGRCFAESVSSEARPDAWRCMAGNRILDPCFEGTVEGRTTLACAQSPWESTVVLLALTEPLPARRAGQLSSNDGRPWALELDDGSRCTLLGGATGAVAGMRVNYGCEGGHASVIGDVDRRPSRWKVFVIPRDGVTMEQRRVRAAWY